MSFIPSVFKSLQRGTVSITASATSGTATITAVNLSLARIRFLGFNSTDTGTTRPSIFPRLELTNGTTVTAYVDAAVAGTTTVSFEVIEYLQFFVKSVQRGTIDLSGVTSNTATITAVNAGRSELDFLGFTTGDSVNYYSEPSLTLTNGTTVTANRNNFGNPNVVGWQVIEWR